MDFDLFLTSPRWEILRIISDRPSSPVEIAKKLNTTVAYASQQLKLLDAAGLLVKEKTGASEKGKPRTLYSISREIIYITSLVNRNSFKKTVQANDHHKAIISIWKSCEPEHHKTIEKFYHLVQDEIESVQGIYIEGSGKWPKIIIISESRKVISIANETFNPKKNKIEPVFLSINQLRKIGKESVSALYDPLDLSNELKGGGQNR